MAVHRGELWPASFADGVPPLKNWLREHAFLPAICTMPSNDARTSDVDDTVTVMIISLKDLCGRSLDSLKNQPLHDT